MELDIINILIIISVLLIILEYKNTRNNIFYFFLILVVGFYLVNTNVFSSSLFSLEPWKLIFIILIFGITFIISGLIKEKTFDVLTLIILVFLGSIILIISDNLITIYLGLELQTFSTFILIAKNRLSIKSSEAGLKYFILGALSSGFYLLGLTILLLTGFSLDIKDILLFSNNYLSLISISLFTLSFCFKLSLFPLHFWIPDIYEGSSWDIISLISTLPKISVISVITQLLISTGMLIGFSILSIIIGTIGSLNQTKFKRLLGYSGISHMGFILLGFSLLNKQGFMVSNIYLLVYMLTMISLLILVIRLNFNTKYIIELGSIKFINKIFAVTLSLLILSIAGIPPLSGFISKWLLLQSTIDIYYNIVSFVIILFSAIGAGYYLRIVKIIYFQKKASYFVWKSIMESGKSNDKLNFVILGFLFFVALFLIFNFSFIIDLVNVYSTNIF